MMEANDRPEPIEDEVSFGTSDDSSGSAFDLQAFADAVADTVDDQEEIQKNSGSERELNTLKARVKELEASLRDEENKYQRLLADFQNLRNRSTREIQSGVEQAERQMLLEVLQVLDSFNRCLTSSYQSIEDFRTGVGLIEKQFYSTLRRLKVTEIEIKVGDTFDAHTAEALTALDTKDFPAGSVMDVCEKGYRIGDQLLRPARVVVARNESCH